MSVTLQQNLPSFGALLLVVWEIPKLGKIPRFKPVIYIVVAKYAYYDINNNNNYTYNHFCLIENKCKHD